MIKFDISKNQRQALLSCHRHFQAAVAIEANRKLGLPDGEPEGIFKCEGGVVVRGHEVEIMKNYLMDDFKCSREPTQEEQATLDAVNEILARTDAEGPDFLEKEYPVTEDFTFYAPLRAFFRGLRPG